MKYPLHSLMLVLVLIGVILTAVYDDIIYPMDDGVVSIGMVVVFALTLGSLIWRANRDEMRRKAAKAADSGSTP